jgi:hypothetical protein
VNREGERTVGREGEGENLGHVEYSPDDPVTAGSLGTWAVRFVWIGMGLSCVGREP